MIWDAPDILIIHFKRFKQGMYQFVKKDDFIDFPIDNLDITKYIHPQNRYKNYTYDLFAINNHTSFNRTGISFGHYYSYCKNEINCKWYNFDDDDVNEIDTSKIKTKYAYILFYKRRT